MPLQFTASPKKLGKSLLSPFLKSCSSHVQSTQNSYVLYKIQIFVREKKFFIASQVSYLTP